MEFLIGSLLTFFLMYQTTKIEKNDISKRGNSPFRYSQTYIYEIVKPLLPPPMSIKKPRVSQSARHEEKTNIKVIILDRKAYFIKDGAFYCADIDGANIDRETAKLVDTMSMSRVQLDKMLFIMDKLREGKTDDSGSAGNK